MKQKRGQAKKRKYPVSEVDDKQNESILEEVLSISGKSTLQSDEMDSSPTDQKKVSNGKASSPSKETDVSSAAKPKKATTKEKALILNEKDHKTKKDSADENTSIVEDESSTAKSKKDDINDKAAVVGKGASVAKIKRSAVSEKSKEKGETAKKKVIVNEEKVVSSEENSPSPPVKKKKSIANKKLASNAEREETVANVPDGWRREIVIRKSGKTAGQIDVYFYSPEGKKLRSRPEVASYISKHKSNLKVGDFDFSKKGKSGEKGKSAGNNVSAANKSKIVHEEKEIGGEAKDDPKSVPPKLSKLSDKVPDSPANVGGKNSDKKEPGKVVLRITEPEPKKVRK